MVGFSSRKVFWTSLGDMGILARAGPFSSQNCFGGFLLEWQADQEGEKDVSL